MPLCNAPAAGSEPKVHVWQSPAKFECISPMVSFQAVVYINGVWSFVPSMKVCDQLWRSQPGMIVSHTVVAPDQVRCGWSLCFGGVFLQPVIAIILTLWQENPCFDRRTPALTILPVLTLVETLSLLYENSRVDRRTHALIGELLFGYENSCFDMWPPALTTASSNIGYNLDLRYAAMKDYHVYAAMYNLSGRT